MLTARYSRNGTAEDIEAAVDVGRVAVDAIPEDHPDRAKYLSDLGCHLSARFQRSGAAADLDAAVDLCAAAVAATPAGHPGRASQQANLAAVLEIRALASGTLADLNAAVAACRTAADVIPSEHPDRASVLSNLAGALRNWSRRTGAQADLDEAIAIGRAAVDATAEDHPDRCLRLVSLADSLHDRFTGAAEAADLEAAIACERQASEMVTGMPGLRLGAAMNWGKTAVAAGHAAVAAQGYAAAIQLLPVVAWHGLDRATRIEHLARWTGLAADAAASALLDRRPELAIEQLEQGRSVLWSQLLNMRGDLAELDGKAPGLAARLDDIRTALDSPMPALGLLELEDAAPAPDRAARLQSVIELGWIAEVTQPSPFVPATALPGAAGHILVAARKQDAPDFAHTVVLLIEHDREVGTVGLVLNRPTTVPVAEPLPEWDGLVSAPPVFFWGGPVSPTPGTLGVSACSGCCGLRVPCLSWWLFSGLCWRCPGMAAARVSRRA